MSEEAGAGLGWELMVNNAASGAAVVFTIKASTLSRRPSIVVRGDHRRWLRLCEGFFRKYRRKAAARSRQAT